MLRICPLVPITDIFLLSTAPTSTGHKAGSAPALRRVPPRMPSVATRPSCNVYCRHAQISRGVDDPGAVAANLLYQPVARHPRRRCRGEYKHEICGMARAALVCGLDDSSRSRTLHSHLPAAGVLHHATPGSRDAVCPPSQPSVRRRQGRGDAHRDRRSGTQRG